MALKHYAVSHPQLKHFVSTQISFFFHSFFKVCQVKYEPLAKGAK